MTKQETFDKVVQAIRAQGAPSILHIRDGDVVCAYRSPGGLKCAAGHLIPDCLYAPSMETNWAGSPEVVSVLISEGHYLPLVCDLQRAHDKASCVARWDSARFLLDFEGRVKVVAADYSLNYTEPQ